MGSSVQVTVAVPEGTSEEGRECAERQAHEAAVLVLWQRGDLTLRMAAEELGLEYHEFLDLLTARGIPVEDSPLDEGAIKKALCLLAGRNASP